ncbi:MAG: hypothetical protein JST00_07810 [Deltaproteobacteria bacterium]|nr:hypothetical protein [Deltaproteobacteria bacterium]
MRIDLRTRLHASPLRRLRTLSASCVFAIVAACSTTSPDEAPGGPDQPGASSPEGSGGGGQAPGGATPGGEAKPGEKPRTLDDVLADLPSGKAQLDILCARGGDNRVTKAFCAPGAKMPNSIMELAQAVGLGFPQPNRTGRNNNGTGGNPGFAVSGHSSSLVARFVSSINPRAIVFSPGNGREADFVAMGFTRGEQFAEIVAKDPSKNELRFFLFAFEQACNATKSCKPGDLLTPAVEKNFTKVTVYEDRDVKNTILDCTQCHQPNGPSTPKMLRMQELQNPWTHFFRDNTPGGQSLIADYQAAHGTTEDLGPIPGALVASSEPANLEDFVRGAGFDTQPNEFQTSRIEQEVRQSSPAQPANNASPGTSTTWQALYDKSTNGVFIPPPYHDVKVTDPTKLAAATQAYAAFRAGSMPAAALPDFRGNGIMLESKMWAMGFAAKPGLDGKQLLVQTCQQCHNDKLDQTITRAKFDVTKLATMDRAEKDKAIERLKLAATDPLKMPPERFRTLSSDDITKIVSELSK